MSCGYNCEYNCEECDVPDMVIEFVNGYNQALDDFVKEMSELWGGMKAMEEIEQVAEQLKK